MVGFDASADWELLGTLLRTYGLFQELHTRIRDQKPDRVNDVRTAT
jgi:hypothetical protein